MAFCQAVTSDLIRGTSDVMRGGEPARKLVVDVSDLESLGLVATGYSWGQAVWGEPMLIAHDGSKTRLVDLKPESVRVGWGTFSLNEGPDGKLLKVADRRFDHGLFAHADSLVIYRLDKKYKTFETWVGINATAHALGSVVFEVGDPAARLRAERNRQLLASFTKENMAALRGSLERLLTAGTNDRAETKQRLAELAHWEQSVDAIRAGIGRDNAQAVAKAAEYADFVRSIYASALDAPLLFVKRHPYMAAHIYDDYLTWHPGGGIYVIENPAAPIDQQIVRAVIDPNTPETLGEGVYRDPDISYDGNRVLFAFKGEPGGDTSIYEIGINGIGLRRLTDPGCDCQANHAPQGLIGKGQHDITPCYLPDDRIAFTSTRTGGLVMCFSSYIDTLHTMNADGSDIRSISVNNQNEFDPAVLPDGRILYGRWEYVDKTALYMQSLWTVNPDGSDETALFANNLAKPTAVLDARPVPGSRLVVAALTPHNGQAVGAIAMIDPKVGKNSLSAITNFTPEYATEMDQGLKKGPSDPWPLSEDLVLIANNSEKHGSHGVIEMVDRYGFRSVIHQDADISCYSPMLVKPRKRPPVKRSRIQPDQPGRFLVHDIYQGMDGIERGRVKWLRVIETTSRISGIPPGGRWWNQAFLASWQGSYDVKRFLGVVPVEADGSVLFEAPVGMAIYFQALDEDRRMIQSQRTFVQSVAGVTRSCMGCHVKEDNAAPINTRDVPLALTKDPATLQKESWGEGFVDYPTMVQPVLDRHCVSCHGGQQGIEGGIDLTGGWTWAFNISYETLIKNTLVGFLNCNNGSVHTAEILDPLTHGSGAAPLADLLVEGHEGRIKKMTQAEKDLLLAWMDGNCNYYGTWNYTQHAVCNAGFSAADKLLVEMEKAGCLVCHEKKIGNDWINLKTPDRSRILRAPMAQIDGGMGLGWCRDREAIAVDRPLVNQSQQPPDIHRPQSKPPRNDEGRPTITFADEGDAAYQAMLTIVRQAGEEALLAPRVDMPGADIVRGACRKLTPIGSPPADPTYP